jgi:hypothetical protein
MGRADDSLAAFSFVPATKQFLKPASGDGVETQVNAASNFAEAEPLLGQPDRCLNKRGRFTQAISHRVLRLTERSLASVALIALSSLSIVSSPHDIAGILLSKLFALRIWTGWINMRHEFIPP